MKKLTLGVIAFLLIFALVEGTSWADSVVLKSGRTVAGTIVQRNGEEVVLLTPYGTFNFSVANIQEIKAEKVEAAAFQNTNRLADFNACVSLIASEPWATNLTQIAATVIDKGAMRNVPYASMRFGSKLAYELNVYGDLKDPAAVEVGVYPDLDPGPEAKVRCMRILSQCLGDPADRETVSKLSLESDRRSREGFTLEITPATADDAYGAWWISVYSERKLEGARASDREMQQITVSKAEAEEVTDAAGNQEWSRRQLDLARPSEAETVSFLAPSGEMVTNAQVVRVVDNAYLVWRRGGSGGMVKLEDLPPGLQKRFHYDPAAAAAAYAAQAQRETQAARAQASATQTAGSVVPSSPAYGEGAAGSFYSGGSYSSGGGYSGHSSSSGGSVYVRGHFRSNGTYVAPHTRSAPRRR